MGAVDFTDWADRDLVLTLGTATYRVPVPSGEDMGKILASAIRGEVNLGQVAGPIPAEVQAVLDTIEPGTSPALGPVWQQLIDDNVPPYVRDRMAYYAVFFWARGREYADSLAKLLWTQRDLDTPPEEGEVVGPKDR